jgi:chemotaxis protein CheX
VRDLEETIVEIVTGVCTTMLGMDVQHGAPRVPTPGERTMVGCVQITGSWSGAVLVSCSPEFTRQVTKILFDNPEEPSLEDERDALGEFTNMIAGNLKAILAAPSYLGLPTVSDGVDNILSVLKSRLIEKFELLAGGHPVTVGLVIRDTIAPTAGALLG